MIDQKTRAEMQKRLDALSDEIDEFKRAVLAKEKLYLTSIYRIAVNEGVAQERCRVKGKTEVVK